MPRPTADAAPDSRAPVASSRRANSRRVAAASRRASRRRRRGRRRRASRRRRRRRRPPRPAARPASATASAASSAAAQGDERRVGCLHGDLLARRADGRPRAVILRLCRRALGTVHPGAFRRADGDNRHRIHLRLETAMSSVASFRSALGALLPFGRGSLHRAAAESVGQAASNAATETGHAVAETGRAVGHAVAEAGRDRSVMQRPRPAATVGQAKPAATGHAAAEAGRETGHAPPKRAHAAGRGRRSRRSRQDRQDGGQAGVGAGLTRASARERARQLGGAQRDRGVRFVEHLAHGDEAVDLALEADVGGAVAGGDERVGVGQAFVAQAGRSRRSAPAPAAASPGRRAAAARRASRGRCAASAM